MPIGSECLGQCRQIQVLVSSQPNHHPTRPAHPPTPPPAHAPGPALWQAAPGSSINGTAVCPTLPVGRPPVPENHSNTLERLIAYLQDRAFGKCMRRPSAAAASHSQSGSRQRFVRVDPPFLDIAPHLRHLPGISNLSLCRMSHPTSDAKLTPCATAISRTLAKDTNHQADQASHPTRPNCLRLAHKCRNALSPKGEVKREPQRSEPS